MKIKHLVAVMAVVSLMTTGCSNNTASETSKTGTTGNKQAAVASDSEKIALPQESPTLTVSVKSIVGNELTVTVMPTINREQMSARANELGTEKTDSAAASDGAAPPPTDLSAEAFAPAAQSDNSSSDRTQSSPTLAELESQIITLPVGVPIVTANAGTNEITEIELTTIQANQSLRIWQNEAGMITMVQVMGSRSARTSNNASSQNDQQRGNMVIMNGGGGPPPGGFGG